MGEPTSRQWYVTTNSESSSPDQMTAELDDAMKTFMQYYNVRNAQLSFGQNGVVQGERAYSWNDSEEAKLYITLTENLFLLASVSKAFCNAAIYTLYPDASIRANTRVFTDVLGYSSNDPTMGDQRLPTITIKNLTDHLGGFNDQIPAGRDNHQAWTETPDPTFDSRGVASFLGRNVTSIQDFVEYAWRNKLDFTPGTTIGDRPFLYSNLGYVILSRVVEVKSGMNYLDFLRAKVTKPIGVQVVQFFTRESQHANDQQTGLVHAESYGSGPPSYDISMNDDVPAVYGGDNVLKEACLGSASLATTASDLVKFIGSYGMSQVLLGFRLDR